MKRITNVHPLLFFLEGYLKRLRIPKDVPRIEKEDQALALQCVRILRIMFSERLPVFGGCKTPTMGRGEVKEILRGCWTPAMGRGDMFEVVKTPPLGRGRAK